MSEKIVSRPLNEEGQKTWERVFGKGRDEKKTITAIDIFNDDSIGGVCGDLHWRVDEDGHGSGSGGNGTDGD